MPALKPAAVAITLVDMSDGSGETGFLLTERASTLRAHRGQWALPGGRVDAGETPQRAALRELEEEVGLRLGDGDVVKVGATEMVFRSLWLPGSGARPS